MIKGFIIVLLLFICGCTLPSIHTVYDIIGNGNLLSEKRDASNFNSVSINLDYEKIIVNIGSTELIEITGDANILPLITTNISKGVLVIDSDESFKAEVHSEIVIYAKSIKSLAFNGTGEIIINNINEDVFTCMLNGMGSCWLFGNVYKLFLSINGSKSVFAQGLIAENVVAIINGGGSAEVYASNALDAKVLGIGELNYYGEPKQLIIKNSNHGISKGY